MQLAESRFFWPCYCDITKVVKSFAMQRCRSSYNDQNSKNSTKKLNNYLASYYWMLNYFQYMICFWSVKARKFNPYCSKKIIKKIHLTKMLKKRAWNGQIMHKNDPKKTSPSIVSLVCWHGWQLTAGEQFGPAASPRCPPASGASSQTGSEGETRLSFILGGSHGDSGGK